MLTKQSWSMEKMTTITFCCHGTNKEKWARKIGPHYYSLQIHPFLLALRSWGRFEWRNISATQRQKFHTDGASQCLHNKYGSRSKYEFVQFYESSCQLWQSAVFTCQWVPAKLNNSSREDYIPQILTFLLEILHIYIWSLWPFVFCLLRLSFVNNS